MPDVALSSISRIVGKSLISAEAIYQDVRELIVGELAAAYDVHDYASLLVKARARLEEVEPIFARHLADTELAAWLAGYEWTANKLPPWIEELLTLPPPPAGIILPFGGDDGPVIRFPLIEKAADSLAQRGILTRAQFDAVSDIVKLESFTVAGGHTVETLDEIRTALHEITREGASLEGFRDAVEERIGASAIGPSHLENIYRTNIQAAFRDGRESLISNPIVSEQFPYQEYVPIHDGRVREEHLALETLGIDGTGIYRRDDPFWDSFTPPWDFQCRCGTNLLRIEAAARKGVGEAKEWLESGQRPLLISRLPFIPFPPTPGFGQRGRVV